MPHTQISLYYKDGSSDKVYHAQIEEAEDKTGYLLNFQYGRRGATLATGTKTKSPVPLELAQKEYAKIVKEKTGKGYTEGESGAVFQASTFEERFTGNVPQLLNNVKETELEILLKDPSWLAEEKHDGNRVMMKKVKDKVQPNNRKGLAILIPESVAQIFKASKSDFLIDGELIGEKYYVFDILEKDGVSLRDKGVLERIKIAASIPELKPYVVEVATTESEKRALLERLKKDKKEGLVFKRVDSKYVPGRPASGGNQLKYKFLDSATVEVVAQHKTKRSVEVAVYDNGKKTPLGKVTIPPNYEIPEVGAVVEVIYMHCFTGGALYQSKYKGVRTDQDLSDCVLSQIKFKPENLDEDDEPTEQPVPEVDNATVESVATAPKKKIKK